MSGERRPNARRGIRDLRSTTPDRILLCRTRAAIAPGEVWTLPGGGLDFGESPATAVVRELDRGEPATIGEVVDLRRRLRPPLRADRRRRRREPPPRDPDRLPGPDRRRRAARRDRRLDRHVRLVHARGGGPDCDLGELARQALAFRAGPRAAADAPEARCTATIGHRCRGAARARLRARPRRRALGAAAPPLRPVAGGRDAGRTARSSWTSSPGAGRSSASSGSAIPVDWRARTWTEPETRRLRFVHVAGATSGMDVTWRIEPTATAAATSPSSTTSARGSRRSRRSSTAASRGRSRAARWRRSRPSPRLAVGRR